MSLLEMARNEAGEGGSIRSCRTLSRDKELGFYSSAEKMLRSWITFLTLTLRTCISRKSGSTGAVATRDNGSLDQNGSNAHGENHTDLR